MWALVESLPLMHAGAFQRRCLLLLFVGFHTQLADGNSDVNKSQHETTMWAVMRSWQKPSVLLACLYHHPLLRWASMGLHTRSCIYCPLICVALLTHAMNWQNHATLTRMMHKYGNTSWKHIKKNSYVSKTVSRCFSVFFCAGPVWPRPGRCVNGAGGSFCSLSQRVQQALRHPPLSQPHHLQQHHAQVQQPQGEKMVVTCLHAPLCNHCGLLTK